MSARGYPPPTGAALPTSVSLAHRQADCQTENQPNSYPEEKILHFPPAFSYG
jgi:hypothetical protein